MDLAQGKSLPIAKGQNNITGIWQQKHFHTCMHIWLICSMLVGDQ